MRPSRRIPLLRGFVAATIATFVALTSHVWVDGKLPGVLGIAVPWLLSLTVCTLLAGRQLSLLRLSASVLVSQLLFHALFVLGSITPEGGFAPHVHGALPLSLTTGAPGLVPQDAEMWFAHAVAAVITVAALHRGELLVRALLALAAALASWLRRTLAPLPPRVPLSSGRLLVGYSAPRPHAAHLRVLRRRGPPIRLA